MAIAYKSQGAGTGTESSGADLAPACPATVDANDILIAQVIHTGTSTGPSTPSGWTLLYGPANVGTTATARHWCFGKLAVGNEDGASISFGTAGGTNGRAARIYSFSGYVSGTLADVVPAASFSDIAHATDPQGPTVTTTVAGALAVALTCQDDNNTEEAIASATGGTWSGFVTYVDATWGPQGIHIDIQVATPTADPGTISGGAMVAANDEASTIGFEIRPNAPAAPNHSASGGVSAASATISGTAKRFLPHTTSGSISAQAATVSGAASGPASAHEATGSIVAGSATVSGTAKRYLPHASSGAISAGSAVVSGTAKRYLPHDATGSIVASASTASGAAQRNSTHVATGTVTADSATVSGSASRVGVVAHDATGAVIAQSASVSGEADNNYEQAPAKNTVAIVGHINRHTREKFRRAPNPAKQRVVRKARTQKRELEKAVGVLSGHWKDAVPMKRTELKVPLMQVEFKHLDFDDDDELEAFL